MKAHYLLIAATLAASPALAQTTTPPPAASPKATAAPVTESGQWRASKLIGVDVYNQQNEKIGEINELLIGRSGQVMGAVVGVGGFLGIGERDVMVTLDKLRFTNDSGSTTGAAGSGKTWVPDKAVMNASKDQLKAMPEFKY